jgi:hypothetical protein
LTENQARVLREARDTEGGAYLGLGSFNAREAGALLEGDSPAATVREVRHDFVEHPRISIVTGEYVGGGPRHYFERFLVPTEYGLGLLDACSVKPGVPRC